MLSIPVFTSLLINPKILINKIDFYLPNLVIENITFFGGLLVILFFLLKNASLLLLTYIKSNFIKKLKIKLSTKLFNNYLFGSYENFLNQEPATISRNTSTIIQYFSDYLTHLLSFFRELSVIMMILIILIVINPITISLITLFLFLCKFLPQKIKPSLKKLKQIRLNKKFTRVVFESFGAKRFKILKKEQDVFNLFYRKMSQYEDNLFFF